MTTSALHPAEWVPSSCTLPTADRPLRAAEFDRLFAASLRAVDVGDRTSLRLLFTDGPGVHETVTDLTERESRCCSFFAFRTSRTPRGVVLEVDVTDAHADVLRALAHRARAALAARR
jgi:hypothetical protein